MNAKEILQAKTSSMEGVTPSMLDAAMEETKVFIQNYCRITYIPNELRFVWANMSYDLIKGQYLSGASSSNSIPIDEALSMSVGDMSISRGSDTMSHKVSLDDLLLNYKDQLNKWRRIDWGLKPKWYWGG